MNPTPTITINGRPYELKNITSTAYVRLAVMLKPTDGSRLSEMVLEKPENITDPARRQRAIADRTKMANALEERLADDITTRRLAYAIKCLVPELEADGLIRYKHQIRPDDWAEIEFEINLEILDILDVAVTASNWLSSQNQQKPSQDKEKEAGFSSRPQPRRKGQRKVA